MSTNGAGTIGIEQHNDDEKPWCEVARKRIEAAYRGVSVEDLENGQNALW